MKKAVKNRITIDDLATMVANGFKHTVTKNDFRELKKEVEGVKNQLEGV